MPSIKKVAEKVQLEIERLDGGLNTKDSPSKIGVFQSPDCLNVDFDEAGSVKTRNGSKIFNTSVVETGSNVIHGHGSFNQSMFVVAGGTMYRASGTTFVTINSSQGMFSTGVKVAWANYQSMCILSEGTNGPWRWEGDQSFYRLGIQVASACSASGTSAGNVAAGTYFYRVSFINSHVVEGQAGTSNSETNAASAIIGLTQVPVGAASQGVAQRFIYRASLTAGPYRYIGTIANNTTTTFADNTGPTTWAVGALAKEDGTAPTPFTTVKLHQERLWFDDSSDRTSLRYTEYQNPFISESGSSEPLDGGDTSPITAIGVQNNLVSVLKRNSIWLVDVADAPDDDSFFNFIKSPANLGIVAPRAFVEIPNGILFVGRGSSQAQVGNITGFHVLSGLDIQETVTDLLRTKSVSENIEPTVLAMPSAGWDRTEIVSFNNKIYIACSISGDTSNNAHLFWLDLNRLGDKQGQPGTWSLWSGINANTLTVHNGLLYAGSSTANGTVYQLENTGVYSDSGVAINSYWWSKEYGGEAEIDSWIKDFRWINIWYELLGAWNMNVKYRGDGDMGSGDTIVVNLTPGGSLWGTMIWGVDDWGGGRSDTETQHSLGLKNGRRIQIRFDNQNAVGQAFKVHALKVLSNLRRQR